MKLTIVCSLVLLAVANSLAQVILYPESNPMPKPFLPLSPPVSRQWLPNRQMWHAQDELGRANFGYAYPGQAAVNYIDGVGNMVGSWSYINPNGKVVATSYTADHRGFRVQSNDLPAAPVAPIAPVAPVAPVVPAKIVDVVTETKPITAPVEPAKIVVTDTKPTTAQVVKPIEDETISKPVTKDPAAVTVADDLQCIKARRKRQNAVQYMVASKEAHPYQYPFMVALLSYNETLDTSEHACGASLISSTKILTAAHCVTYTNTTDLDEGPFRANLGMHFRNKTVTDAQAMRKIIKIKIHEDYNPFTKANDVAILTLDSPVEYTKTISPVCLAPKCMNAKFVGRTVTAMGWGHTVENGTVSDYLRHNWFKVISNVECRETYGDDIDNRMFCTYKEGQDTCQGDSGGPLVTDYGSDSVDCRFVQVGIVSFGDGCARKDSPGVYMKVTAYVPWILNNLNEETLPQS